jgi:putative phosphoesterase
MRVAIVSDLHGNWEALSSLPIEYDELWVLGDLVNYGPNPAEVVDFVRANAAAVVRGNHDHSAGFGVSPRSSTRYRAMAQATGEFTASVLSADQKAYLRDLPLAAERTAGGCKFHLCHATPSDPLFTYCAPDAPQWQAEAKLTAADILLVGHTHVPFLRSVGKCEIVNPGSLGQPKNGSPRACYAVWEDGSLELRSCEYAVDATVRKIRSLPVPRAIQNDLAAVLLTGCAPA